MQVFKLYNKIFINRLPSTLIYFAVFAAIAFIMTAGSSQPGGFEKTRITINVIDNDNTASSGILVNMLKEDHNVKNIGNDEEKIYDELFYQVISYSLTINEGFEEALAEGRTDGLFDGMKMPSSYGSVYFENDLNKFVSSASAYIAGGSSAQAACEKAAEVCKISTGTSIESFSANSGSGNDSDLDVFMQYLGYIFVCMMVAGISPIIARFNSHDIKNRMNCSAMSLRSYTLQLILGVCVSVALVWTAYMALAAAVYKKELFSTRGLYSMLNSFAYLTANAGIAAVIAQLVSKESIINNINTSLSLGMSFLCGVFVPQYLLGEGVLKAARYLPAYWYIKNNNMIFALSDEAFTARKYLLYVGIQLLFTAAFLLAVPFIARSRAKEK